MSRSKLSMLFYLIGFTIIYVLYLILFTALNDSISIIQHFYKTFYLYLFGIVNVVLAKKYFNKKENSKAKPDKDDLD